MSTVTLIKEMTGWSGLEGQWLRRRHFTPDVLAAIAERIRECERDHEGELVVAIEAVSPVHEPEPHMRALEVFGRLRVWDTPGNTGMLLYLALDKHRIEIIADCGIAAESAEWEAVCTRLQARLAEKAYAEGILAAIEDIESILRRCCPASQPTDQGVEGDTGLANEPVLL